MAESIIHIRRPTLTPEEREKRLAEIKRAAANLIIAAELQRKAEKP